MFNPLKIIVQKMLGRILPHPRSGELLAYGEGQLSGFRQRRVARHLATCPACRFEVGRLERTLNLFIETRAETHTDEVFPTARGLSHLRASIHAYNDAHLPAGQAATGILFRQTAMGHALVAELGVYVGRNAVGAALEKLNTQNLRSQDVIYTVEPLLKAFLGRNAASAVIAKILLLFDQESGQIL